MTRLAIFASGSGTNAEAIAKHFGSGKDIEVALILSNKKDAFVLERAKNLGIKTYVFNRDQFYQTDEITQLLQTEEIDYIVLAGFLWLVPRNLVQAFPAKIINIHPSLIPKHCGKGMYGSKVHEAVIDQGDAESGITIHLVDEIYDNGKILRQEKVTVEEGDDADSLASKIHALEYEFFPKTIEAYINRN